MPRRGLPAPTKWLLRRGLVVGRTLDYGCGKCHELNNRFFVADGYDPFYRPHGLERSHYDTIICNFVLNVIPNESAQNEVIGIIKSHLFHKGNAYISVRNDIKKLRGYTKRGTWQGNVIVPGELLHSTNSYRLYRLTRDWLME